MKLMVIAGVAILACVSCEAAVTNLLSMGFNDPVDPWASTGEVSFTTVVGSPVGGVLDGATYAHGTNFSGSLTGNYGIQLWIKTPGIVGDGEEVTVVSIGSPDGDGISLRYNSGSGGYFTAFSNGIAGGGLFTANHGLDEWTHVAVVYAGNFRIYIDGEFSGTVSAPVVAPSSDWYLFTSGASAPKLAATVAGLGVFTFHQDGFVAEQDLGFFTQAIPEPASWAGVAGLAVLGVAVWRRR